MIEEEKEAFSVYKDAKRLASMALISSKIDEDLEMGLIKLPEELEANKIVIKREKGLQIYEPKSLKEAMASPYKDYWLKAMEKEANSLESHETWEIVPKDASKAYKPLKTRWVYKIKESLNYFEFKARFVAKRFE